MMNRYQTLNSSPYHDETTDNINVASPIDIKPNPEKRVLRFDEDIMQAERLELLLNRFENLMKDLNRTPIKTIPLEPVKRLSKIKKPKPEEVKVKREKPKRLEQQKSTKPAEIDKEQLVPNTCDVYDDLFKQIRMLKRGKNR